MSMAKITHVTKSRKSPGKCQKCGIVIERGMPYMFWKFRYGGKRIRCAEHPPEPWERESNSKRQDLMRASDAFTNAENATTPDDAAGYLQEARDYAESARDAFQSAVDGWSGTGLEQSEMAQNFDYAVSDLDDWISDVEQAASELEAWEPEEGEPDDWSHIINDLDAVPEPDF